MDKLKIEYQYFEGCPNHTKMKSNLIEAIKGLEDKIDIAEVLVEDFETAREVKFRGSPTLLIDGEDIELMPAPVSASLSCRFYPKGVPSAAVIRDSILSKIKFGDGKSDDLG